MIFELPQTCGTRISKMTVVAFGHKMQAKITHESTKLAPTLLKNFQCHGICTYWNAKSIKCVTVTGPYWIDRNRTVFKPARIFRSLKQGLLVVLHLRPFPIVHWQLYLNITLIGICRHPRGQICTNLIIASAASSHSTFSPTIIPLIATTATAIPTRFLLCFHLPMRSHATCSPKRKPSSRRRLPPQPVSCIDIPLSSWSTIKIFDTQVLMVLQRSTKELTITLEMVRKLLRRFRRRLRFTNDTSATIALHTMFIP